MRGTSDSRAGRTAGCTRSAKHMALGRWAGRSGRIHQVMRHSSGGGSDGADGPVVTLAAGRGRGIERGAVAAWLGRPFAEPRVGRRRFRAPEPKAAWTGVRPATRFA